MIHIQMLENEVMLLPSPLNCMESIDLGNAFFILTTWTATFSLKPVVSSLSLIWNNSSTWDVTTTDLFLREEVALSYLTTVISTTYESLCLKFSKHHLENHGTMSMDK